MGTSKKTTAWWFSPPARTRTGLAEETGSAVVVVRYLNKASGGRAPRLRVSLSTYKAQRKARAVFAGVE